MTPLRRLTLVAVLATVLVACGGGREGRSTGSDTTGDDVASQCIGDPSTGDLDGDGQCDDTDLDDDGDGCLDVNDSAPKVASGDSNGNGVPDDCDGCDDPEDDDGDGVCNTLDTCVGSDDAVDGDGDGVPDGCDACPEDATDDSDGDGVCDGVDACPDADDAVDTDGDGTPDGCDACPEDATDDSDGDGVCDGVDICAAGDDNADTDGDDVPNACDTCPGYVDGATDADEDGWDVAAGDCDDCDPAVYPGLYDIPGNGVDEDCSGGTDDRPVCDAGLAINDIDPSNAARALDLCGVAATQGYGLQQARWVRANGVAATPGQNVGLVDGFGTNLNAQHGDRLLVLSTGFARDGGDSNCGSKSCNTSGSGTPPPGFPQPVPSCDISSSIADDIALELVLVAPSNALGFRMRFFFMAFDWAEWVCTQFNDAFVAIMSPPPPGAVNGNIALDINGGPVGVNMAHMVVCDPAETNFGFECASRSLTCPTKPSPYCPMGSAALVGTGFDNAYGQNTDTGGGSGWLEITAPVTPGSTFTLRLAIWDGEDGASDSTVLLDAFEWLDTAPQTGVRP